MDSVISLSDHRKKKLEIDNSSWFSVVDSTAGLMAAKASYKSMVNKSTVIVRLGKQETLQKFVSRDSASGGLGIVWEEWKKMCASYFLCQTYDFYLESYEDVLKVTKIAKSKGELRADKKSFLNLLVEYALKSEDERLAESRHTKKVYEEQLKSKESENRRLESTLKVSKIKSEAAEVRSKTLLSRTTEMVKEVAVLKGNLVTRSLSNVALNGKLQAANQKNESLKEILRSEETSRLKSVKSLLNRSLELSRKAVDILRSERKVVMYYKLVCLALSLMFTVSVIVSIVAISG